MSQPGRPDQTFFDLLDAFSQPGCAVCGLLAAQADRLVQSVLYERWQDQPTHDAIRARRGSCPWPSTASTPATSPRAARW